MALPKPKARVKFKDGADFWNFDTSKGRDISLPRFIVGCAIHAKNLTNLKSRCLMFVLNFAPTGDHAKRLKCLQAGGCAIAPSIPAFFCLVLQLLPQECGTNSRGALEDFFGITPFQLGFEVICSHFLGGCALYSCTFEFGFAGVPPIPVVFWWIFCKSCNFSNLFLDLQPFFGIAAMY